jgi:Fe2+ transport system protein FeoA
MRLSWVRAGQRVRVVRVEHDSFRVQAIRLGLGAGAELMVWRTISGGPVVVRVGVTELAVGRQLADAIEVETVEP